MTTLAGFIPKIYYTRFPVTFSWTGKLPTCWQQVVVNCKGIWETTRHNRHNRLARANLLQTCYGKTRVMDSGGSGKKYLGGLTPHHNWEATAKRNYYRTN